MATQTFEATKRGYANLWERAQIKPERRAAAQAVARKISANRARYLAVGLAPWWWIGITHNLEASGNFGAHLHNGDPLTARTVHVPAGRPATGSPPFSWEASAADALRMHALDKVDDWSTPRALFEWERYNGFGYVAHRVNSPYLWSFTDQYSRGKYVSDGKWSATAVSGQCGAAATLKAMEELKLVTVPAVMPTSGQAAAINIDKPVPPIVTSPVKPAVPQWDVVGWTFKFIGRLFS